MRIVTNPSPVKDGKSINNYGQNLLVTHPSHFSIDKSKKVEGVKKLELGVITTQEAAYQLYLSLGFRKVGEQKYSVKVGDKYFDEYLMEICFD